jgi:hypothetical protein
VSIALNENYLRSLEEQKKEVRSLVMNGLEQVEKGRVKDFNMVCNKLEKKYQDDPISN